MRLGAMMLASALAIGCQTTGGDWSTLTQPERDAVTRSSNVSSPDGGDGGFELDSYKQEQAEADGESPTTDDADALAAELGAEGVEIPDDVQPTPPGSPPLAAPGYPPVTGTPTPPPGAAAPPAPRWTPADAVTLSWGLRLVSTVDASTPPRAILGMPDGSEEVVKAGDLIPEAGVVVLAVGQGVVQLGRVTPNGDHARVESVFLQAMFDGGRQGAAGVE